MHLHALLRVVVCGVLLARVAPIPCGGDNDGAFALVLTERTSLLAISERACLNHLIAAQLLDRSNPCQTDISMQSLCPYTCGTCGTRVPILSSNPRTRPCELGKLFTYSPVWNRITFGTGECVQRALLNGVVMTLGNSAFNVTAVAGEPNLSLLPTATLPIEGLHAMAPIVFDYDETNPPVFSFTMADGLPAQHLAMYLEPGDAFVAPSCGSITDVAGIFCRLHYCRLVDCDNEQDGCAASLQAGGNKVYVPNLGGCIDSALIREGPVRDAITFVKRCSFEGPIKTAVQLEGLRFCTVIESGKAGEAASLVIAVEDYVTPLAYQAMTALTAIEGFLEVNNSYGLLDLSAMAALRDVGLKSSKVIGGQHYQTVLVNNPHLLRLGIAGDKALANGLNGLIRGNPNLCVFRNNFDALAATRLSPMCFLRDTLSSVVFRPTNCVLECVNRPRAFQLSMGAAGETDCLKIHPAYFCPYLFNGATGECGEVCANPGLCLPQQMAPHPSVVIRSEADLVALADEVDGLPSWDICDLTLETLPRTASLELLERAFGKLAKVDELKILSNDYLVSLDFFRSLADISRLVLEHNTQLITAHLPALAGSTDLYLYENTLLCTQRTPHSLGNASSIQCPQATLAAGMLLRPLSLLEAQRMVVTLQALITSEIVAALQAEGVAGDSKVVVLISSLAARPDQGVEVLYSVHLSSRAFLVVHQVLAQDMLATLAAGRFLPSLTHAELTRAVRIDIQRAADSQHLGLSAQSRAHAIDLTWTGSTAYSYRAEYRQVDCAGDPQLVARTPEWASLLAEYSTVNPTLMTNVLRISTLPRHSCFEFRVLGLVPHTVSRARIAVCAHERLESRVVTASTFNQAIVLPPGLHATAVEASTGLVVEWSEATTEDPVNEFIVGYDVAVTYDGSGLQLRVRVPPTVMRMHVDQACRVLPATSQILALPERAPDSAGACPTVACGFDATAQIAVQPLSISDRNGRPQYSNPVVLRPRPEPPRNLTAGLIAAGANGGDVLVRFNEPCLAPPSYVYHITLASTGPDAQAFFDANVSYADLPRGGLPIPGADVTQLLIVRVVAVNAAGTAGDAVTASLVPATSEDPATTARTGHGSNIVYAGLAGGVALLGILAFLFIHHTRRRREAFRPPPKDPEWEIDTRDLTKHEIIGQGAFGEVRLATFDSQRDGCKNLVAVKQCTKGEPADRKEFLCEADVMKTFGTPGNVAHRNVVRLIGVVSQKLPLMLIMEYCPKGDIRSFLYARRQEPELLPPCQLSKFAGDIAAGMSFLALKAIVHRDLAARNCLVAQDLTVKISDYGLARNVHRHNYYRKQGEGAMPVRWMSLESLRAGIFTTESDVWSFGVVLFEIYSYGDIPYGVQSNQHVYSEVCAGLRMGQPKDMPDEVFALQVECWCYSPDDRPRFYELETRLAAIAKREEGGEELASNGSVMPVMWVDEACHEEEVRTDSLRRSVRSTKGHNGLSSLTSAGARDTATTGQSPASPTVGSPASDYLSIAFPRKQLTSSEPSRAPPADAGKPPRLATRPHHTRRRSAVAPQDSGSSGASMRTQTTCVALDFAVPALESVDAEAPAPSRTRAPCDGASLHYLKLNYSGNTEDSTL